MMKIQMSKTLERTYEASILETSYHFVWQTTRECRHCCRRLARHHSSTLMGKTRSASSWSRESG